MQQTPHWRIVMMAFCPLPRAGGESVVRPLGTNFDWRSIRFRGMSPLGPIAWVLTVGSAEGGAILTLFDILGG